MINDGSIGPDLSQFEYKLDDSAGDYMKNWFVTMDLMCLDPIDYTSVVSWFFIGYIPGTIFFFLPDLLGRKFVMNLCMVPNIMIMFVGTFSKNLDLLKIAAFFHGFFHIKVTVCYTSAVEFMPDKYKTLACTVINCFNVSEYIILGLFYLFIEPDTDTLLIFYFVIGVLSCILYVLFIPESPFWHIANEGPNSQKAIKDLNYIAWFNGSSYHLPEDSSVTLYEKANEEEEKVDKKTVNKKSLSSFFKELNMLISDKDKLK